jgi:hypothetical protein
MLYTANDRARFATKWQLDERGCWIWNASRCSNGRYGEIRINSRKAMAHRVSWQMQWDREVPEGLEIDHLCGNTRCVNPAHLEAVTHRENQLRSARTIIGAAARKTSCAHGHLYDSENTKYYIKVRKAYYRKKAAVDNR